MTRVLFPDLLASKLDIRRAHGDGTYWSALQRLVADHNTCSAQADRPSRRKFREIRALRQLDKDEPTLTFYLFAALSRSTDKFRDSGRLIELLTIAYRAHEVAESAAEHLRLSGWDNLWFEFLSSPSDPIIESVKREVEGHPVAYIREVAEKNCYVGFEGETVFDAFVGDQAALYRGRKGTGIGIEVKFTSDISNDTTYSTHRNQIVRNLEVGNSHFDGFYYLFIAPRKYWERRSRFYVYKMDEYLGDGGAEALDFDSLTKPGVEMTGGWKMRLGRLAVEDVVDAIFPGGAVGVWHADAGEFAEFLKARNLWPRR
jgi:hypothetical protein